MIAVFLWYIYIAETFYFFQSITALEFCLITPSELG